MQEAIQETTTEKRSEENQKMEDAKDMDSETDSDDTMDF